MSKGGVERRKFARKEVLETFHVFIVVPKLGQRRLQLRDVSEGGMAFVAEESDGFAVGKALEIDFCINPNLKLPLSCKIVRVSDDESGDQKIGCEFDEKSSKGHLAFVKFLGLLDELAAFLGQA